MKWFTRLFGKPNRLPPNGQGERSIDATSHAQTTKEAIAKGWNGLDWGATISEFRAQFPKAQPKSGWWVTGLGRESFCGVLMDTQYAFGARDEFYMVAFYPSVDDRERVSVAALNDLGPPDGVDIGWTIGDVAVEVKTAGVAVTMTHAKFL